MYHRKEKIKVERISFCKQSYLANFLPFGVGCFLAKIRPLLEEEIISLFCVCSFRLLQIFNKLLKG